MAELIDTVRKVSANQKYIPPAVGAKLAERINLPQLSDREREVLKLMSEGQTNQGIAEKLSLSESTVEFHINNIFSKLGVSDRTQAVLIAIRRSIGNL
ncbi:hypothetical protein C7B62_05240 [Pleurocapsa sp. CCALA 161]|uniref:response regulator transcription factor n=1 Tax=Pleurocapsa sp. CCALA 161 TaxID=2107688 RepID=UPI000D0796BD|nr:response regulator transcription factor [Pleurocapsa sp. CCALA 161]PSB11539.1 hypothetical protein C7B62_05240 [Pleurocapsa sp. CCALA 161]